MKTEGVDNHLAETVGSELHQNFVSSEGPVSRHEMEEHVAMSFASIKHSQLPDFFGGSSR